MILFLQDSKDIKDSYNKNGISHLFALSGMHVSLLTAIILFFLKRIMNDKTAYLICSLFLLFYICYNNNYLFFSLF